MCKYLISSYTLQQHLCPKQMPPLK